VSIQDLTAGTGQSIGRYFSLVSMMPSTLLTLYSFFLVKSGAWNGRLDLTAALTSIAHPTVGGAAALIVVSISIALFTHPVQFAIVQFFEGYWGEGPLAIRTLQYRAEYHERRRDALCDRDDAGDDEAGRLLEYYPDVPNGVMPTRLGNVLRRYEMQAGRQYGLDVLVVLPHVALVAESEDLRYLKDQRAQMDLAIRMCFTSLLACALSVLLLWRTGFLLLIALIPYGLAYLAYRGAITTAREYGKAMMTVIDLNRFALYSRMHLQMPDDIEKERAVNKRLTAIIDSGSTERPLDYVHPDR
jgi:hypothetical protein